jgi:hypothetical protein
MTKLLEKQFPYPTQKARLDSYNINKELLEGNHWEAFALQGDKNFTERYAKLRYVVCNFAGLISKVIADILFGEEIQIKAGKNQEWLESLYFKNKLQQQNYESAMSNSAQGDAVYKIRVENKEIFIDDVNPSIYFPHLDKGNPRRDPKVEELAWTETIGDTKYLISELHEIGKVSTVIHELDAKGNLDIEISCDAYNAMAGTNYIASVNTGIKHKLLVHIPNYRFSGRFWGVSDYNDINSLLFALNNRMTKLGNILDKHSDPILAVPEGVLDENGQVKKEKLSMIEIADKGEKPEYIVWNANLESAFKEIDKLVDFLFMFSETSPDVLGMGKSGAAESGRALKMRLIRTLAKKNRKQLYYDQGLREILFTAQELSRKQGYTVNGVKCPAEAEIPFIKWADGVVNDQIEEMELAKQKLDAGLTTKVDAIMVTEGLTQEDAEKKLEEITEEKKKSAATFGLPVKTEETKVEDKNSLNTLDKDKKPVV